jgi:molybdopterin/thiamine biosynthesis adenylyltransferase
MSMQQDRFSRQILAFGKNGQKKIFEAKVGVVGLGGTGSLIVQMLAYLGVGDFLLIDDDIVESSNLNRLVGASLKQARGKTPKIEVAKKVIRSINPKAKIKAVFKNLREKASFDYLSRRPEIIFGCVDNDSARLILTELAAAYNKTLIDSAAEIINRQDFQEFGGRVIVACPGDFCLLCAGQIDLETARQELESPAEKIYRKKMGYGLGPGIPDPAVISLNGVIAGLAVTEFLMLVTGLRLPNRRVTYKGMRGVFRECRDEKRDDCWVCNSLVGQGKKANINRYLKKSLPVDLPV